MRIVLDTKAGTCGGVRRAIQLVEEELETRADNNVFVLGDVIHNEKEVERLNNMGLKTLNHLKEMEHSDQANKPVKGSTVLIRAHGEPPDTFKTFQDAGIKVIDGTCPVVTRSQKLARDYLEKGYQLAIIGKHHHPEVIGIMGHAGQKAMVIQYEDDVEKLSKTEPTFVMAQTTISEEWFVSLVEKIRLHCKTVEISNTICRFVLNRDKKLPEFALSVDVILVVGGHKSSNTKMLFETCKLMNPRSYHIVSTSEIDRNWFQESDTIGITGSASTPLWLLHEFVSTLTDWIDSGWIEEKNQNC